ncbi:hypothetical protein CsSME_00017296 [Camellia sinensis var. sinensis]
MATLPSISSSFLPSTALTIHPQYQQQFSLFFSPNQSIKTSPNRMAFKVELPKVEPKFKAPFLGFTRTAETWKSRACMIGLIGTLIVELEILLSLPFFQYKRIRILCHYFSAMTLLR